MGAPIATTELFSTILVAVARVPLSTKTSTPEDCCIKTLINDEFPYNAWGTVISNAQAEVVL